MLKIPFEKKKEMMAIDVEHLTEVRQGLDYLPWVEALLLLNEHFPDLYVDFDIQGFKMEGYEENFAYITAKLTDVTSQESTRELFFPVMDYKHKAKTNPDVVDINNAIMRASVKVIAIETGIGLSLFRKYKEDIPTIQQEKIKETVQDSEQVKELPTSKPVNPFKKKLS